LGRLNREPSEKLSRTFCPAPGRKQKERFLGLLSIKGTERGGKEMVTPFLRTHIIDLLRKK